MTRRLTPRILGATACVVACAAAGFDVCWFFGFTRFYFPQSPISELYVPLTLYFVGAAYFASVTVTGRWASWRRRA